MTDMTQRKGHRKPAQLEMIGGKSARQRVWEELRKTQGKEFTARPLSREANVDLAALRTYFSCLQAGGYISHKSGGLFEKRIYTLVKDTGIEAPRLNRKGQPIQQGQAAECMWRTLRMLGQLDAARLVAHASASGIDIALKYAKSYLYALKRAGYLHVIKVATRNSLESYSLKARMNTGPRPPQVQSVKTVYDPNLNKVMYAEDPQELL